MQNRIIHTVVAVSAALAAASCTELTTVGGERHPTLITPVGGELLQPELPALGDVDGDGFDDFILLASPLPQPGNSTAYLFYGKPSFEPQLESRAADATFEVGTPSAFPLRDVNGDGFADFALGDPSGFEFIFGGPKRLTGHHEKSSTGRLWSYDAKLDSEGIPLNQLGRINALGDLDGDGYADISVQIFERAGDDIKLTDYVVMGRKTDWPTGKWDPSWAAAELGAENGEQNGALSVLNAGDFDGDGRADLLTQGAETIFLFYGKSDGLHGRLTRKDADAELDYGRLGYPFVIGDLDGDGRDDVVNMTNNELQFFYGSRDRYAGLQQPKPDLTFYDQGPYNSITVGDYDGDGHKDILFVGNAETKHWDSFPDVLIDFVVYQVRGTAERLTGRQQVKPTDIYQPNGYPAPAVLDTGGFNLHTAGDLDGDGSSELIVGAPGQQDPADSVVLLLPGGKRVP